MTYAVALTTSGRLTHLVRGDAGTTHCGREISRRLGELRSVDEDGRTLEPNCRTCAGATPRFYRPSC